MVYGSMLKISGQRPWISIFFFNFILKTKKKESIEISNICGMDEQKNKKSYLDCWYNKFRVFRG